MLQISDPSLQLALLRFAIHAAMRRLPQTRAAGSMEPTAVAAIMYWSVAPRRRGCSTGDRTQRSAGCRTNGSARPTAGRSPDGRPRPCADQTPAERALARVIRVATAGKAQDQTHGKRARYNQSSCHFIQSPVSAHSERTGVAVERFRTACTWTRSNRVPPFRRLQFPGRPDGCSI